mgnify:CR=1 FL=1
MKTVWAGVLLCAVAATPALAESRYDRKIEQAAMDIVAGKIGDIRGGLSFNAKGIFITIQDLMSTDAVLSRAAQARPGKDNQASAVQPDRSRATF